VGAINLIMDYWWVFLTVWLFLYFAKTYKEETLEEEVKKVKRSKLKIDKLSGEQLADVLFDDPNVDSTDTRVTIRMLSALSAVSCLVGCTGMIGALVHVLLHHH
jgi:hypothetical protein